MQPEVDLPRTDPKTNSLTLENWKRGVITLIDDSRLPKDALAQADNIMLVEDGQPSPRWGVDWYGTEIVARGSVTQTRTNLVTNPSLEVDTTGYAANGYSLSFDGSGDYVLLGTSSEIQVDRDSTLDFLLNTTAGATRGVFYTNDGAGSGYEVRHTSSGFIQLVKNGVSVIYTTSTVFTLGVLQRITITWENGTGALNFYKDGVLVETGSSVTTSFTHGTVALGRTPSFEYTGKIYQARIFNVALTDAEVLDLHNGAALPTTNLSAEYLLETGSGTSIVDTSGNSNTGTITGATWVDERPTLSASAIEAYTGSNSLLATFSSTPPTAGAKYQLAGLTGSVEYSVSMYFFQTSATDYCGILIPGLGQSSVQSNGSWNRVTLTFTASGTTQDIYVVNFNGTTSFYADGLMCTQEATAGSYFDGAITDTSLIDYAWTGTANTSTSTETIYARAPIEGFGYHDTGTTSHLLAACGGKIWRSTDNATTWTECTGATYTAGNKVEFNQNSNFSFITTGQDNIARYDATTTLDTYSTLATPTLTSAAETGMTGSDYTYYFKIARVNEVGFSIASAGVSETTNTPRSEWVTGTKYITLTLPAYVADQTRFDIYMSEDNGVNYYYLDSVNTPTLTYVDDGSAVPIPSTLAPTESTAQGPKVEELVNIGSRMYGIRDTVNTARIWWTGAGTFAGSFSTAYDGGYLDWQEGGKNKPVQIRPYRDGKGTPYATVWCDSADGQGMILQMTLEVLTIGDVSITVPSAYELPGSRGTPAPCSVLNVLNDYFFYNSQAIYNLGSRQNLQQILSTDEMSANIRPDIKRVSKAAENKICATYFDAKVFFSLPYGSTTNNAVAIYDTERRAWMPKAFDIGFNKFLHYTDTNSIQHLLAYKDGDYQLSQISSSIQGDYGVAFTSVLKTGLYPTVRNRFEFQWLEEGEFELANARGEVKIDLWGIERRNGFKALKSPEINIATTISNTGWDTYAWDSYEWDKTDVEISLNTESSIKRYFNVQQDVNAVQWVITTNNLDSGYILRTLQTWGTQTFAGKPRGWKVQG